MRRDLFAKNPEECYYKPKPHIDMLYSRLQRAISVLTLSVLLLGPTVRFVDLSSEASADAVESTNIVSLIVEEGVWNQLDDEITQYADDIRSRLPNTRAVIFTVSSDINPYQIASLNERLYYEGIRWKGLNHLVGSVLIGNVPLPVVHADQKTYTSVWPYVDFDEKAFLYDHSRGVYTRSESASREVPEIWHGVISPNSGNASQDMSELRSFLGKVHESVQKTGRYAAAAEEEPPYVFYYDGFSDQSSIASSNYRGYQLYLENLEDIVYKRYSKRLATYLQSEYKKATESENGSYESYSDILGPDLLQQIRDSEGINFDKIPVAQTTEVVKQTTKRFFEVFNGKSLGDVLAGIANAGRYGLGNNARVDVANVLIAKEDRLMEEVMKNTNDALEAAVNDLVENKGLSRKIPLATRIDINEHLWDDYCNRVYRRQRVYVNYLYGNDAQSQVADAYACSISRGGGLTSTGIAVHTEQNKGFNVNSVQSDVDVLRADPAGIENCMWGWAASTQSLWGGNSWLNFDQSRVGNWDLVLGSHRYTNFIRPIFDNAGASELWNTVPVHTPQDCLARNFIQQGWTYRWSVWPNDAGRSGTNLSCITAHQTTPGRAFEDLLASPGEGSCTYITVTLNGSSVRVANNQCSREDRCGFGDDFYDHDWNPTLYKTYSFKTIPSAIRHASPTSAELGAAMKGMTTPSLPVDRDRYIDFISAKGNQAKIEYANLFRIRITATGALTDSMVESAIRSHLQTKSAQINAVITAQNPSGLTGQAAEIRDLLRIAPYPAASVDLWGLIDRDPILKASLIRAIKWYNLATVTEKYAAVMERSLDSDGNSLAPVAGHRKSYEVAYIASSGVPTAMNIFLDPEDGASSDPRVASIRQNRQRYTLARNAVNTASRRTPIAGVNSAQVFKCGPADGVELFQWFSAIQCWLQESTKIGIEAGYCGPTTVWVSENPGENGSFESAPAPIVYSGSVVAGTNFTLRQTLERSRLLPNSATRVRIDLLDPSGRIATSSDELKVELSVSKIVAYSWGVVSSGNARTVYDSDSTNEALKNPAVLARYTSHKRQNLPFLDGSLTTSLAFNSEVADITVRSRMQVLDRSLRPILTKQDEDTVLIRDERIVSVPRVFIAGESTPRETATMDAALGGRITFTLTKYDRSGTSIPLSYPITARIYDDISDARMADPMTLSAGSTLTYDGPLLQRAGNYRIEFKDARDLDTETPFTVLPWPVRSVAARALSDVVVVGQNAQIALRALDQFGNTVTSQALTLRWETTSQAKFLTTNQSQTGSYNVTSVDGTWKVSLATRASETLSPTWTLAGGSVTVPRPSIRVVDNASVVLSLDDRGTIIAGGASHTWQLKIVDSAGNPLALTSAAAISVADNAGVVSKTLLTISGGVSEPFLFSPGTRALSGAQLLIQVPGVPQVVDSTFTILPWAPMELALTSDATQLEALTGSVFRIRATLLDRYSNVAWNHPSGATVRLEIPTAYRRSGSMNASFDQTLSFSRGIADTTIRATEVPGRLFLIGTAAPALENNSFSFETEPGRVTTVNGISQDVLPLATTYVWNRTKIDRTDLSSRVNLLMWAGYGDTSIAGYLGGATLFAPTSASLASITLTTAPSVSEEVISLVPSGGISVTESTPDTTTDISLSTISGNTALTFADQTTGEGIARVHVKMPSSGGRLVTCGSDESETFTRCPPIQSGDIALKVAQNVRVLELSDALVWSVDGREVGRVTRAGRISLAPDMSVSLDTSAPLNFLALRIESGGVYVASLALRSTASSVALIERDTIPTTAGISLEILSPRYRAESRLTGQKSTGERGFTVIRQGAVDSDRTPDDRLLPKGFSVGLENAADTTAIGYTIGNRMMLEYAAGQVLGEAARQYMSFATVVLGDPVTQLASRVESGRSYDQTTGIRIASAPSSIENIKNFDFNADGRQDVAIFQKDGHIRLSANYTSGWRDLGNLGLILDSGTLPRQIGHFSERATSAGHFYDSIALTDKNGKLLLIDNQAGRFTRRAPTLVDSAGGVLPSLSGSITQMESADMDQDGLTDIVVLTDRGELTILYGVLRWSDGVPRFRPNVVDRSLGLTLSGEASDRGGAVTSSRVPQYADFTDQRAFTDEAQGSSTDIVDAYERTVRSKIFVQRREVVPAGSTLEAITALTGTGEASVDPNLASEVADAIAATASGAVGRSSFDQAGTSSTRLTTYIRSEFVDSYGMAVQKKFADVSGAPLLRWDRVHVTLTITNAGASQTGVVYLDSIPSTFSFPGGQYTLTRGSSTLTGALSKIAEPGFDFSFDLGSMRSGERVTIEYDLTTKGFSVGTFTLGDYENGEGGADAFGDIALDTKNLCGADINVWRSTAARSYARGTKSAGAEADLPEPFKSNNADSDGNGVPDNIDAIERSGRTGGSAASDYARDSLADYQKDSDGDGIPDREDSDIGSLLTYNSSSNSVDIGGLSDERMDEIDSSIDEITAGLGCGFGGGGCISMPLNYTPLAPGSSLSILGNPVIDPAVDQGLPVFSALTWMYYGPVCGPIVWPVSPLGQGCGDLGAGGWLGTENNTNFIRLFVTPTLTGAGGVAICLGPASTAPDLFPEAVSPVLPGGNCIVAATPLSACKPDGSNGNVRSLRPVPGRVGTGGGAGAGAAPWFVNGGSCRSSDTIRYPLSGIDRTDIRAYLGGDRSRLTPIASRWWSTGAPLFGGNPAISIGENSGDPDLTTEIDIEALSRFEMSEVVKVNNDRVSGFPDFIMSWVTRQLEEIVTKLTDLPTLYIVLPEMGGSSTPASATMAQEVTTKAFEPKSNSELPKVDTTRNAIQRGAAAGSQQALSFSRGGLNWITRLLGGMPMVSLDSRKFAISIPMITRQETDKTLAQWKGAGQKINSDFSEAKLRWAGLGTATGAVDQTTLRWESLMSSIQQNIAVIESYQRFPEKLQKFFGWKDQFIGQVLCNIGIIEELSSGWMTRNGQRFKAWVELFVLIRAILDTWQAIIDLFVDYDSSCGVCRNERHDLKYWKFKMLSMVLPQIPVIPFPKWPDIILDLHNIRFDLAITIPEFAFDYRPINFPGPPTITFPGLPTAGFSFPRIPVLPRLPELPELPELPSLPKITLPDIPPPPKIPKIFGGIAATVNILKLFTKVMCILRKNPFVPEWRAGDQIAQITERQWKTPSIDFLSLEYPTFSAGYVDAIKLSTYVNYEFSTDFIEEAVGGVVAPINRATSDFTNFRVNLPTNIGLPEPPSVEGSVTPGGEVTGGPITSVMPTDREKILAQAVFAGIVHFFTAGAQQENMQDTKKRLIASAHELASSPDERSRGIAERIIQLQWELEVADQESQKVIADIQKEQAARYDSLRSIVERERDRNRQLQKAFDDFFDGRVSLDRTLAQLPRSDGTALVSAQSSLRGDIDAYNRGEQGRVSTLMTTPADDTTLADSASRLKQKTSRFASSTMREMIAAETSPASSSPSSGLYSFAYNGLYVLDGSEQRALTSYTDEIDKTATVTAFDADNDGDIDALYRMGNEVYLKINATTSAVMLTSDEDAERFDLEDILESTSTTSIVAAPNYTVQGGPDSGRVSLSFSPAHSEKDRVFTLEYTDYIDRYDRSEQDARNIESLTPSTRISRTDMVVDDPSTLVPIATNASVLMRSALGSILPSSQGEAYVEIPRFERKVRGEVIASDPGSSWYTLSSNAIVELTSQTGALVERYDIDEYSEVSFTDPSLTVTITAGELARPLESRQKGMIELSTLAGYPLLDGTIIDTSSALSQLRVRLSEGGTRRYTGSALRYQFLSLGAPSNQYQISLNDENTWYYARLGALRDGTIGTAARITLLSPQLAADVIAPEIDGKAAIRVPVYQTRSVDLSAFVSDTSGISSIALDFDPSRDTDDNGILDDDDDLTRPTAENPIRHGSGVTDIVVGRFDHLVSTQVMLIVKDSAGNVIKKMIPFQIYAPTPQLTGSPNNELSYSGSVSERLDQEPVHLVRARGSRISVIGSGTESFSGGSFSGILSGQSGIDVRDGNDHLVARINDTTGGMFPNTASGYSVRVLSADADRPTTFEIVRLGSSVYSAALALRPNTPISLGGGGTGIIVETNAPYAFERVGASAPSVPNGGYIVDSDAQPLIALGSDGQLYEMASWLLLEYENDSREYARIRILERATGTLIATITYRVDIEYILP